MSDVDLLRQAATRLEVHVKAAAEGVFPDTWEDALNNWLGGPVGEYCALMSPAVATALAMWLERYAEMWLDEDLNPSQFADAAEAIALARAILGETEHKHAWVKPTFPGYPRFCMCGAREGEKS